MRFYRHVLLQLFCIITIFGISNTPVNSFPRGILSNTYCFTLADLAAYCPNAQYATITIQKLKMDANGFMIPIETYTGPAVPTTKKYVDGYEYRFWESNQYRKDSYEDLFRHAHNGRSPTPTELANITATDAEAWFRDKYKVYRNPFPYINSWYTYPERARTYTETKSEICFSVSTQGFHGFDGWVTFPSGEKCKLDFTDWIDVGRSGKSKIPLKFPYNGCAACLN